MKGLFIELASLLALVLGIFGAIHFSYFIGDYLKEYADWKPQYINLTAFAITFVAILLLVSWLGKLLTKVANFASLGLLNKLLGGLFGGMKIAVILSAVILFFEVADWDFSLIDKEALNSSVVYGSLKELGRLIFGMVLDYGHEQELLTPV